MSRSGAWLHPPGELRNRVEVDVLRLDESQFPFHAACGLHSSGLLLQCIRPAIVCLTWNSTSTAKDIFLS